MSLLDRVPILGRRRDRVIDSSALSLGDVVDRYDIVSVNQGQDGTTPYIVVTDKTPDMEPTHLGMEMQLAERAQAPMLELGTSSPSPFTSFTRKEYNVDWQGLQGLQKADQMRRSDGVVRGTLRALKTPVLAGRWFVSPASQKPIDVKAADFVWKNLTELMTISWTQVLTEALLMADFGYYMFEKVWTNQVVDGQMRTIYQKLAPRHPMDIKTWLFDEHGGPAGVVMWPRQITSLPRMDMVQTTVNGRVVPFQTVGRPAVPGLFNSNGSPYVPDENDEVPIPISKLLVFSFDREAGNIEGISVLRSAYKHWFFKEQLYKIDAIQKERHGIGIPVIKLPPNYSTDDKKSADELGRNLRTNERAHVVLPPNWELLFAKLEGHVVDALASAEHHNAAIRENILASFLGEKTTTKLEDQTMFLKASRFIADIVCDTFNMYAIPQLIDFNFSRAGYPKLRARRIGESEDQRTMSFTVRNLIGAGAIIPDDTLDAYLREVMDLPPIDKATQRPTQIMIAQEQLDLAKKTQADNLAMQKQAAKDAKAAAAAQATAQAAPSAGGAQPGAAPVAGSGQPGQPGVKGKPGRKGHSGEPGTPGTPGQAGPGKQKGQQAGLPRQQPTPPSGPPRSNAGTDRSGK
jgi:hypothetical protein